MKTPGGSKILRKSKKMVFPANTRCIPDDYQKIKSLVPLCLSLSRTIFVVRLIRLTHESTVISLSGSLPRKSVVKCPLNTVSLFLLSLIFEKARSYNYETELVYYETIKRELKSRWDRRKEKKRRLVIFFFFVQILNRWTEGPPCRKDEQEKVALRRWSHKQARHDP
jgi:hypothetical protein